MQKKILKKITTKLPKMPTFGRKKPVASHSLKNIDDLINMESGFGRAVFGKAPAGVQREFFYHQNGVWIFHEETETQKTTIRYEVKMGEVIKFIPGKLPEKLSGAELANFAVVARTYLILLQKYLYEEM